MVFKYDTILINSYEDFKQVYNTEEYLFNMSIYKCDNIHCPNHIYMSLISFINIIKNNNYDFDILIIYDILQTYNKYYDKWNKHLIKKLCTLSLSTADIQLFTFLETYNINFHSKKDIFSLLGNNNTSFHTISIPSDKLFLSIFYLFHDHLENILTRHYNRILSVEIKKLIDTDKKNIYNYMKNSIVKPYKEIIYTYFINQIKKLDDTKLFMQNNINICININTYVIKNNISQYQDLQYLPELIQLLKKLYVFENYFDQPIRDFFTSIKNDESTILSEYTPVIFRIIQFAKNIKIQYDEFIKADIDYKHGVDEWIDNANNSHINSLKFFNEIIRSIDTMNNIINIYDRIPSILTNFTNNSDNNIYEIYADNFTMYMRDLKIQVNTLIKKCKDEDICIKKIIHYMLIELNIVNIDYSTDYDYKRLDLYQFRYVSLYKYLDTKTPAEINDIINMDNNNIALHASKNKRVKINEHIKLLQSFSEKLKYKITQQESMITKNSTNNTNFNTTCTLHKTFKRYLLNEYILKESLTTIYIINLNENGNNIPIKYILYKLQNNISYKLILSSIKIIYNIFNKYNNYVDISNKLFEHKYNKIEISKNVKYVFKFLYNITITTDIRTEILEDSTQFTTIINTYTETLSNYLLNTAIEYCNDLKKYRKTSDNITRIDNINDTLRNLQSEINTINSTPIFTNIEGDKITITKYLKLLADESTISQEINSYIANIFVLYSEYINKYFPLDGIIITDGLKNTPANIIILLNHINTIISINIKKIKYLKVFSNNCKINYYDILKIYQYIFDIIMSLTLNMSEDEKNYKHKIVSSDDITMYDAKVSKCLVKKFTHDNKNHLKKLIMHMCNSIKNPLIIKLDEINPDDFRLQNLMVYANSIDPYTFLNIDLEIINSDLNKITSAITANMDESNECHAIEIKLQNLITSSNNSWNENDKNLTTFSDNVNSDIDEFISCREKIKTQEDLMLLKNIDSVESTSSSSSSKSRSGRFTSQLPNMVRKVFPTQLHAMVRKVLPNKTQHVHTKYEYNPINEPLDISLIKETSFSSHVENPSSPTRRKFNIDISDGL